MWSIIRHIATSYLGALVMACILWVISLCPQVNLTYRQMYDFFRLPPGAWRALILLTPSVAPILPFFCTYIGCFCFYCGTLYLLTLVSAYNVASLDVWTKERKRLLSLGILHLLVAFLECRKRDHTGRWAWEWVVYQLLFVTVHTTWVATEVGGLRRLLEMVIARVKVKDFVIQEISPRS